MVHPFRQVMVTDRGNNTAVAEFMGGTNIEIRVQNRIIAVMLVTLPVRYRSATSGLMGNYNGDDTDDLIPKGSTSSIPVDSSMEQIFDFGRTCRFHGIVQLNTLGCLERKACV